MRISLRQLEIFEAVAQSESYTRAAERLHMTQPAVSMQIKQLEEISDIQLFERHGKRIVLTSAGREMHKYSSDVTAQYHNMIAALGNLKNNDQGNIRVSAATTANHLISHMLARFTAQYEGINFSLDITNRESLLDQLYNYDPDLVIMGEPPTTLKLTSEEIMDNPLVMIAPPGHPLAGKKQLPLHELVKCKFIVREQGSGTKAAIERFFHENQHDFVSTMEMSSNEAIKHAVMAGLGLGIVSLHTIKLELQSKNLVILDAEYFPIMRKWHIVRRKGKRLSPAARLFQKFVLQEADEYVSTY